MSKPRKVTMLRSLVVPIVGDAAIAGPVADGRLIPVLILDTAERPEIAELIRVHELLPPGDAESQWGFSRENKDHVMLHLRFVRPMEVELILLFSAQEQAVLVEGMLSGGGVYLQAGAVGDHLSTTLDSPRVLVELPDTGFRPHWEAFLLDRMTRLMSQRLGTSRRGARTAAEAVITQMKEIAQLRLSTPSATPTEGGEGAPS
jgi:hypothetical protein